MDEFEFDQEKFKKLEECKVEDYEDSEVKTEDAISIAYDLSEYGDGMVDRLFTESEDRKIKALQLTDLKTKLTRIIEEQDENDDDGNAEETIQTKGITSAQLEAYQKLLQKLDLDQENGFKQIPDDVSSVLWTMASTQSKSNQTLYSLRKVKDYLQKKAKQAKLAEVEKARIEEKEAVKKMIEEDKKSKNKLSSLFNPLLAITPITESNPENEEAKEKFVKRIQELTMKENDPFKKFKQLQKQKKKNPEKVHMMAVEAYLRDLESKAMEDKRTAVQQRPLNEEVIKKEFSKGISAKFQITKCDLWILGTPHSATECINHQQMIKLKGKHEAAHEIQGVLRDQIKYKKDAERKAKIEKQSVRGFL